MSRIRFTIKEEELITFKKRRYVRAMVARAVSSGEMRKPYTCELCRKRCNTQAHHVDYGQPYKVIWLCASCHGHVHTKDHTLNPNNNAQSPLPACLDQYKTVSVTFSVPVENFIAMKREADRLNTQISTIMRKEALGKFPIDTNQLQFDLGDQEDDKPQIVTNKGVCSLAENESVLPKSKSTVLQKIRRKRDNGMQGVAGRL